MEHITFTKHISAITSKISELEKQKNIEIWSLFQYPILLQIYKELCAKIPETKLIEYNNLFNKSIHPVLNKQELINKYDKIGITQNKKYKYITIINELWNKLSYLWIPIDIKYEKEISHYQKQLSQLDNNENLKNILSIFEDEIKNSVSIEDLENKLKKHYTSDIIQNNLMDLLEDTKNILSILFKL